MTFTIMFKGKPPQVFKNVAEINVKGGVWTIRQNKKGPRVVLEHDIYEIVAHVQPADLALEEGSGLD